MPRSTGKAVQKANKASAAQLAVSVPPNPNLPYRCTVAVAATLLDEVRNSVWKVFENNMRDLYARSSFGWNPTSKRRELFGPLSRFILVYLDGAVHELVAFVMFRFEYEEGENLLYCYDLQVSKGFQRLGLGKILMQHLAAIGAEWDMAKMMLTVFKANSLAFKFYETFGFTIDPSSPSAVDEETDDVDYEILSKII